MMPLIGFVMLVVGVGALLWGYNIKRKGENSLSWKSTEGEILSSNVAAESSGGGYGRPNTTYKANIQYKYKAGRKTYTHDKICVGGQMQLSWGSKAEDYCQKYPEGKMAQVYYDPDDPQEACLERREETSFFYMAIGGVLGVTSILILTSFI